MPIYGHSCGCGHEFESVRKFTECGVDQPCPECGQMAKQVISTGGLPPWQPFYCETQSRFFPTRESYTKYCRSKGLTDGISRGELNFMREEARYLKECEDAQRREAG